MRGLFNIHLFIIISLIACIAPSSKLNSDSEILFQKNDYAQLFKIGFSKADTFLFILNPENKNHYIQKFAKSQIKSNVQFAVMGCALAHFFTISNNSHRISAVDNVNYYSNHKYQKLPQFYANNTFNFQTLSTCQSKYIINSMPLNSSIIGALKRLEITPITFFNHLENHPLGSAEWLKVISFFCNNNTNAFEIEKAHFNQLTKSHKPKNIKTALVNAPYLGVWYISNSNSTFSRLLQTAGFKVVPNGGTTGSSAHSLETIFQSASNAQYWFNPGLAQTKTEILNMDARFKNFKPYKTACIVNSTKQLNTTTGTNPYFEIIDTQPSLILKDLIQIYNLQLNQLDYFCHVQ